MDLRTAHKANQIDSRRNRLLNPSLASSGSCQVGYQYKDRPTDGNPCKLVACRYMRICSSGYRSRLDGLLHSSTIITITVLAMHDNKESHPAAETLCDHTFFSLPAPTIKNSFSVFRQVSSIVSYPLSCRSDELDTSFFMPLRAIVSLGPPLATEKLLNVHSCPRS